MMIGVSKEERTSPDAVQCAHCVFLGRKNEWGTRFYKLSCAWRGWTALPRYVRHKCPSFIARGDRENGYEDTV